MGMPCLDMEIGFDVNHGQAVGKRLDVDDRRSDGVAEAVDR